MVDMRPATIAARLRELARQSDARGFIDKGVDMSARAVTARLRTLGALADMCQRLRQVGQGISVAVEDAPAVAPSAAGPRPLEPAPTKAPRR